MEQLHGARLCISLAILCVCLFLSALESSIIATALVSISTDLGNYSRSSWIVTSYLMTYTGFLIVFARLSDIFGRKLALLTALAFFIIWSLACALAHTMEQLIVFRAFQGIGGAGLFSLVFAIFPEITPAKHYGIASGLISAMFSLASIIGPVVGGAIASNTTWRWVFYFNLPPGAIAFAAMSISFPGQLPSWNKVKKQIPRIDYLGVVLSLSALVLLIFPLQQGGSKYPWNSPTVIATFVFSGVCWVLFSVWQWYLSSSHTRFSSLWPLLPTRILRNRVVCASFACSFLTGFPFMIAIIYLPQRFQIENGLSPVDAGLRILPLLLVSAFVTGIAGIVCSKKMIAAQLLVFGTVLQVIGIGLLSTLPTTGAIPAKQYGFQVILGCGFGLIVCPLFIIMRVEADPDTLAVMMGCLTQFRILGGVIGIAIAQAVFLQRLRAGLSTLIPQEIIQQVLQVPSVIERLPSAEATAVRSTYGEAFNVQTRIVTYISIAAFIASLFTFYGRNISLAELQDQAAQHHADQSANRASGDEENARTKQEPKSEIAV